MSSQTTLRAEGLYERYWSLLAAEAREEITQLGAPSWLPLGVALAHYRACDALGLSELRVADMAQRVGANRDGTFLGVALNLARGLGATPLTMGNQLPRIWQRAFQGGAVSCVQTAPKELCVQVDGWPCAGIPYCRYSLRGLCVGVAKLVAREVHGREVSSSAEELVLHLAWA